TSAKVQQRYVHRRSKTINEAGNRLARRPGSRDHKVRHRSRWCDWTTPDLACGVHTMISCQHPRAIDQSAAAATANDYQTQILLRAYIDQCSRHEPLVYVTDRFAFS